MSRYRVLSVDFSHTRLYVVQKRTWAYFIWAYRGTSGNYWFLDLEHAGYFNTQEDAINAINKHRKEDETKTKWFHFITRRPKKTTVYKI